MRYYRFPDNQLTRIAFAGCFFAILLLARDTLITSSVLGFYKATFIMYGIIGIMGIAFLVTNRRNLRHVLLDERMILALAATVIYLVPMLAKQDWQLMYFSILICIYFAVFISYFISLEEVARIYVVVLSALSIYSWIASYLLEYLVETQVIQVPIFSNGVHEFYNFGLAYSIIWPTPYFRNFGIFREPGVYQFFIILALILNNYFINWNRQWKMWIINIVMAITMLTTFATGGMAELILLILVVFIDKKWYKNKAIIIAAISVVVVLFFVIVYSFFEKNWLYKTLFEMIEKLFYVHATSSGGVRVQSILYDLRVFLQNPLFGEKLVKVMYPDVVQFNTTSTMILFAGYGILGGFFHAVSWFTLLWDKNRKTWVNLALLLIMFMSFNTAELSADMFLWLFPVMAMVERGIPFVKSIIVKRKV